MPKVRPRKTFRGNWTEEKLINAKILLEKGFSMRAAAKKIGIAYSTLQERMKKDKFSTPVLGRHAVFTQDQEFEMAKQIKHLALIFYGCTAIQVRKVAYQYAVKNGIKHQFNNNTEMAGRDWLERFLSRNDISIRKAEGCSLNRVTAFNKAEVDVFFKLLEEVMEKYKFSANNIYNFDETGISTVQDPGKILAAKGQRRVGSITSWERGRNTTVLCAMSAAGGYVPPMFIFARKRHTPLLEKDGPIGALYKHSKNGWINEDIFNEWLLHFTQHAKPNAKEPVLLILDNHASHFSLKAYDHCKTNNIVMLSIPPHSSHRMQPLDVILWPFKGSIQKTMQLILKIRHWRKNNSFRSRLDFSKSLFKCCFHE